MTSARQKFEVIVESSTVSDAEKKERIKIFRVPKLCRKYPSVETKVLAPHLELHS